MDFEPSEGKYLAYPHNREIIVIDCESWSQRMTFTHSSVSIFNFKKKKTFISKNNFSKVSPKNSFLELRINKIQLNFFFNSIF